MSQIIYETINFYNIKNNIFPYRYIGSDEHNKPKYFGSNKKLKKDIQNLGSNHFKKRTLYRFNNISNVKLREFESKIQKILNCANNPSYYNKTNTSHKGYVETNIDKNIRMKRVHKKYNEWINSTNSIVHKKNCGKILTKYNKTLKGKSFEEIYGEKKAKKLKENLRGLKNPNAKKILYIPQNKIISLDDAINKLGVKPMKKKQNFLKNIKNGKYLKIGLKNYFKIIF